MMPKYNYECEECMEQFTEWHSMGESANECPIPSCRSKLIIKIPSLANVIVKDGTVGKKVESFIDDSRSELKAYKEQLEEKR